MKAKEILEKKLAINSSWYGYASYEVVDFEIVNDTFRVYYESHYNGEAHIYNITFNALEMKKLTDDEDVVREAEGEVTTTTTYRLV
jgi:hypothetical protein